MKLKWPVTSQFDHEFYPVDPHSMVEYPTLIVMHGRGDSLKPFRKIREELGLSKFNLLLLNAPRKYLDGYTWYAFPPNQGREVSLNRDRLKACVRELEFQGFNLKSVFFLGFSQGALMSIDFVLHSGIAIGGIIAMSGYIYFFENWKKRLSPYALTTPVYVSHGTEDSALPFAETEQQVQKLIEAGLKVSWNPIKKDHEIIESKDGPSVRKFLKPLLKFHPDIDSQSLSIQ